MDADGGGGENGGVPCDPPVLTEANYRLAVARAEAYVRSAQDLYERAAAAQDVATARLLSCAQTLRIARQVLDRIHMLGTRIEPN